MTILLLLRPGRILLALPWMDLPDTLDTLTAFVTQVPTWLSMAISHPAWAIVAVLTSLVCIQIVIDLFKRAIKTSLTLVIKLPLVVSQWLWQRATTPSQPSQSVQVNELILRLEALRSEQDQVIAELKALLPSVQTDSNGGRKANVIRHSKPNSKDSKTNSKDSKTDSKTDLKSVPTQH